MSNKAIFVGVHFNRKGERVIEYDGETICTVAEMREMLKSCDDVTGGDDARITSLEAEIEHLNSMVTVLHARVEVECGYAQWLRHRDTARKRNAL